MQGPKPKANVFSISCPGYSIITVKFLSGVCNTRLTLCIALTCCISWPDTWQRPCWGSWRRTAPCCIWSCCTASHTHKNHCLSPPGSLGANSNTAALILLLFLVHVSDVETKIELLWSKKQQSESIAHQELDQHTLCTAQGCSMGHLLYIKSC